MTSKKVQALPVEFEPVGDIDQIIRHRLIYEKDLSVFIRVSQNNTRIAHGVSLIRSIYSGLLKLQKKCGAIKHKISVLLIYGQCYMTEQAGS
jgi:hypothetical protein